MKFFRVETQIDNQDRLGRIRYFGHVTSVAVYHHYRQQGIGKTLMQKLHSEMADRFDTKTSSLHCRVTNLGAISLYEKIFNYKCVKRLRGYYADHEDAWYK